MALSRCDTDHPEATPLVLDAVDPKEPTHKFSYTSKVPVVCGTQAPGQAYAPLGDAASKLSQREQHAMNDSHRKASCDRKDVKALVATELNVTSSVTAILALMKSTEASLKCSMALSLCYCDTATCGA